MIESDYSVVGETLIVAVWCNLNTEQGWQIFFVGALLEDLWLFSLGFFSCVLVVFWEIVQQFAY